MDQKKNLKQKTLNLKVKALETKTAARRAVCATAPVIGSS